MLDISLLRNDPEKVRENIRKKFQDQKLPLVDEVIELDKAYREAQQQADALRNQRKVLSKQIGGLIGKGQVEEAEKTKARVAEIASELEALEVKEQELQAEVKKRMMVIPNIIDPSVPIGKDDSENVAANPSCRIMKFLITSTSWSASEALISMQPAAHPAMVSTIWSVILPACTVPSSPTAATL